MSAETRTYKARGLADASDPERIYLEPGPPFSPEGRLWCKDDVWPLDEGESSEGGVAYVRADRVERLEEAVRECEKNLRVIHEAIGEVPWDPTVKSTFAVWELCDAALTETRAEGEG